MKANSSTSLSATERAVYELLLELKGLSAPRAALYEGPLRKLVRAGLVVQRDDGSYHASGDDGAHHGGGGGRPEPMTTLVVRVPVAMVRSIDEAVTEPGQTRSDVTREVLARGLGLKPGANGRKPPGPRRPPSGARRLGG